MPPPLIDTGNTAFMLLCDWSAGKNVMAITIQSFASIGSTTVLWKEP
jgi:hypothetical protein